MFVTDGFAFVFIITGTEPRACDHLSQTKKEKEGRGDHFKEFSLIHVFTRLDAWIQLCTLTLPM